MIGLGFQESIGIVLVNWNGWRDCVDCIDSVLGSRALSFHIYLVDNDSTDDSIRNLRDWCENPTRLAESRALPGVSRYTDSATGESIACRLVEDPHEVPINREGCRLSIVSSGGNLGFAGGNNVGLRLALREGCTWAWLLNTDTAIHADALHELLSRARQSPDIGITGSTLIYYDDPSRVQALGGTLNLRNLVPSHIGGGLSLREVSQDPAAVETAMTYVVGASMLVPRQFIEQIGFMQDDYFLYFEELDWAMRARGAFQLAWAPSSLVWHKVGGSSAKRESLSLFSMRLLHRNRIRFAARFFPARIGAVKRQFWLEMLRHCLRGRWREARVVAETLLDATKLVRQVSPV